jgi:protein-S-isoprenylcysteine O-methyltransferase Ste14
MDSLRYFIALLLLVSLPPAFLFWMVVHPFARFWRGLGPWWTHGVVWTLIAPGMVGLFRIREPLLASEFGTRVPLVALGVLCLIVAGWLRLLLHRHFSNAALAGLPELDPKRYPGRLVTEGLYARIRHPRYVQFALALLGWALIVNYLAVYVIWSLWWPAVYLIAILEERELRERFGPEYEVYCRHVPRFLPRFDERGRRHAAGAKREDTRSRD